MCINYKSQIYYVPLLKQYIYCMYFAAFDCRVMYPSVPDLTVIISFTVDYYL